MRISLDVLDDIRIASPCRANWEGMVGNNHARHCADCGRTVYDLSALTADQAVALIREKEGALCLRLFRRPDGRVLTADCPVGLKARLQRVRSRMRGNLVGSLIVGSVLAIVAWFSLLAAPSVTMGQLIFLDDGLGVDPGKGELLPPPSEEK
jgi:hypothetical protein